VTALSALFVVNLPMKAFGGVSPKAYEPGDTDSVECGSEIRQQFSDG
jgi:hypothetical protein